MLNQIEKHFVEFLALRLGKEVDYVRDVYIKTKDQFRFETPEFKDFTIKVYDLNKLLHDEETEEELISTYKYHELMSAFRFLSYTFETKKRTLNDDVSILYKALLRGEALKLFANFFAKKIRPKTKSTVIEEPRTLTLLAEYLIGCSNRKITRIVDYGCGPAYLSFEIAKKLKESGVVVHTVLVDIDCLMKDFAVFRFQKEGLSVETISVNKMNLYPELPQHDLCIATEVMEHIKDPVRAFLNIDKVLEKGGILHGNYNNHTAHMLHVSPNLTALRKQLDEMNYVKLSKFTFLKN